MKNVLVACALLAASAARADTAADCAWFRALGERALAATESAYRSGHFSRRPDSCGKIFAGEALAREVESPRLAYLWEALTSAPILTPLQRALAREVRVAAYLPLDERRLCERCSHPDDAWGATSSSTRLRLLLLSSRWLDEPSDAVLAFVLAHELGHLVTGVSDTPLGQFAVDAAGLAILESVGLRLGFRDFLTSRAASILSRSHHERRHSRAWYASRCAAGARAP